MKNVNELRIPAYAVVDMSGKEVVALEHTRDSARGILQEYKHKLHKDFKILKLKAEKFVR